MRGEGWSSPYSDPASAVSGAGSVVSAEPRSVAGSAELDLTAYAGEASASLAFAATEAFPSRQVLDRL